LYLVGRKKVNKKLKSATSPKLTTTILYKTILSVPLFRGPQMVRKLPLTRIFSLIFPASNETRKPKKIIMIEERS
jgi:hypothetical protein